MWSVKGGGRVWSVKGGGVECEGGGRECGV